MCNDVLKDFFVCNDLYHIIVTDDDHIWFCHFSQQFKKISFHT